MDTYTSQEKLSNKWPIDFWSAILVTAESWDGNWPRPSTLLLIKPRAHMKDLFPLHAFKNHFTAWFFFQTYFYYILLRESNSSLVSFSMGQKYDTIWYTLCNLFVYVLALCCSPISLSFEEEISKRRGL